MKKTCVVTGGTSGIGFATSYQLAEQGCVVIVVGRNAEKCKVITEKIKKSTGNTNIHYVVGDLSLKKDVMMIAKSLSKFEINVLINNAGCIMVREEKTSEGIEKTFALNHLGVFTLTLELIELLKANNHARIINVASAAHFNVIDSSSNEKTNRTLIESIVFKTNFNVNDLQSKNKYKGAQQYSRSKLMNVLFTYKLALEHLKGTNITANCLHPGFVASKFGHNNTGFFKSFLKFGQRVGAVSLEDGSRASTFLALSDKIKDISGKYFNEDCTQIKSSSLSYNKELQDSLWEQSKQLIKLL